MIQNNKNILINDLELLDRGFNLCCEAAACTYGAEGRLALLEIQDGNYTISKDGFSVMRHVKPSNKIMAFGALQATTGAAMTVQRSGDSSTTTAILMQNFLKNLDRKLFNKKVEKGILEAIEEVYTHLEVLSKPATKEDLRNICRVSLNNDHKLADIVISAFDYAGENGIVEYVIKKGKEFTEFVPQNGLLLDGHGYLSEFFINDRNNKLSFEAENVAVICSATWSYDQHIINQIQAFYSDKTRDTPLILFLEKPDPTMVEKLIGIKGVGFNICAVACNGYSEFESETLLNDVANFTGASVYNPRNPDSKVIFGLCDKVVSTIEGTSISVENVPQLHTDTLETLKSAEVKDERRIKRLTTKSAIVEIGNLSESGAKEEADRIDDCLGSIKTTLCEGTVAGGGSTFVHISGQMFQKFDNKEVQRGYDLVKTVLLEPFKRLLKNANRESVQGSDELKTEDTPYKVGDPVDYITPALNKYGIGYNVQTDEIEDLIDSGIIDSKKSLRIALQSSVERSIQMFNISVIACFPSEITL